jgi:hypothetical protein
MNQTLMTFDFYSVHMGLARYGNNNNIMNVQGAKQEQLFNDVRMANMKLLCNRFI